MVMLLLLALCARPAPLLPSQLAYGTHPGAWVLIQRVTFKSMEALRQAPSKFVLVSQFVQGSDPNSYTYAMIQSDQEPLEVLILSRYAQKPAYKQQLPSPPFSEFRKELLAQGPPFAEESWNEVLGYYEDVSRTAEASNAVGANGIWCLAVSLTFASEEQARMAIEAIGPLEKHVRDNEPHTLGYSIMQSDSYPHKVMVLERYTDKEDAYLKVHRTSKPFLAFKEVLSGMDPVIDGHSYYDAPELSSLASSR